MKKLLITKRKKQTLKQKRQKRTKYMQMYLSNPENRAHHNARQVEYTKKPSVKKHRHEYRISTREHNRFYQRKYYAEHRDEILLRQRKNWLRNKK